MKGTVWRSAAAEFLGTFALCVIGAGAICTNQWTGGAVGLLGIALAHGTVLAVMVSGLGHLSGGHFNPAVTLGILAVGKATGKQTAAYLLAQLGGAAAAGYLLTLIFPPGVWEPVHLGTPGLAEGVTIAQGLLVETVLTFFLVLTVFATAVDPKGSWHAIAGFGIGAVLIFDILVGGPLTGASMNPARTFGPAVASGFWDHHLLYWVGPVAGGLLAASLYNGIFLRSK